MRNYSDYSKSWKKARRAGARAERDVAQILKKNTTSTSSSLRLRMSCPPNAVKIIGSRLVSSDVVSGKVPPKADVEALYGPNRVGISVKAFKEGRLASHTVTNLCEAMDHLYGYPISPAARSSLDLLVGGPHVANFYTKNAKFHSTHRSDVVGVFDQKMYRPDDLSALLQWLSSGMPQLADFLFSRGLGRYGSATHLWYYCASGKLDTVCEIESIVDACRSTPAPSVSAQGAGMGIRLPFGSMEADKNRLVFRHSYASLLSIGVPFR